MPELLKTNIQRFLPRISETDSIQILLETLNLVLQNADNFDDFLVEQIHEIIKEVVNFDK
jgi:hypothetical protein